MLLLLKGGRSTQKSPSFVAINIVPEAGLSANILVIFLQLLFTMCSCGHGLAITSTCLQRSASQQGCQQLQAQACLSLQASQLALYKHMLQSLHACCSMCLEQGRLRQCLSTHNMSVLVQRLLVRPGCRHVAVWQEKRHTILLCKRHFAAQYAPAVVIN